MFLTTNYKRNISCIHPTYFYRISLNHVWERNSNYCIKAKAKTFFPMSWLLPHVFVSLISNNHFFLLYIRHTLAVNVRSSLQPQTRKYLAVLLLPHPISHILAFLDITLCLENLLWCLILFNKFILSHGKLLFLVFLLYNFFYITSPLFTLHAYVCDG